MSRLSRRTFLNRLAFGSGQGVGSDDTSPVLVFVFLRGGADTLNMVIPYGDDDYYKYRSTIAVGKPVSGSKDSQRSIRLTDFYSLHPRLSPWKRIFSEDRLAIIQAVGSDNISGSHFEAQDQMEHGESYKNSLQGGWLGRHLYFSRKDDESPLSAVSFSGIIPESLRGAPSVSAIQSLEDVVLKGEDDTTSSAVEALSSMYGHCSDMLGHAGGDTIHMLKKIQSIRGSKYKPEGSADYPGDQFGKALTEVARLIKADLGLRVACIDHGGWDTHFVQGGVDGLQAQNIDSLARGLDAFDRDIGGLRKSVTVVVMTEFGRRSYENSSLGTDHGRGFSMFVISNQVFGGGILGDWPGLNENQDYTLGSNKVLRRLPGLAKEQRQFLGPSGLSILIDYRDVLWEVLEDILGNKNVAEVFPGFVHQKINLVKA